MDNYNSTHHVDEWSTLTEPTENVILQNKPDVNQMELDKEKEEFNEKKPVINKHRSPILSLQLSLCLLVLILLFLAKAFAPDLFQVAKEWYDAEITASVYFDGDMSQLDYSAFFEATKDEV